MLPSLEIKDAQLIFNRVWKDLESELGRDKLQFSKELILLGGAPGSGKGTNTAFICGVRGISAPPTSTSIGYGTSFHGVSALLSMLNSCAPGVTVVNIDNGFGAAFAASRINRRKARG